MRIIVYFRHSDDRLECNSPQNRPLFRQDRTLDSVSPRLVRLAALVTVLLGAAPAATRAQDPVPPDSVAAAPADTAERSAAADSTRGLPALARRGKPPASPTGALARSLIVPGWGQFALGRTVTGTIFVASEVTLAALLVREQRRLNDLLEATADTAAISASRRKREDFIIYMLVNHVAAGIEAYVAAHLWDFPKDLRLRALPGGMRADYTIPFRVR